MKIPKSSSTFCHAPEQRYMQNKKCRKTFASPGIFFGVFTRAAGLAGHQAVRQARLNFQILFKTN
jgi:hypothetical protein